LFWGIIGALIFRAIFIFAGVALIKKTFLPPVSLFGKEVSINIVLTAFGIFLIYAGIKSWFSKEHHVEEENENFDNNVGARIIKKLFRVSKNYHGDQFFTVEYGKRVATRLLLVLGVIEFTDLIFAVDSIPAIFAIAPDDPFILYTSNIFAILGLRSLYFLLANFIERFNKLKYGLAVILAFIGVKMLTEPFLHISEALSLSVVGGVLLISLIISLATTNKGPEHSQE
jgi:tellurite resistance protein TerC